MSQNEGAEVKCGTFDDWSFGGLLHRYRIKRKITLRMCAKMLCVDPGNLSKLERSIHSPPATKIKLMTLIKNLNLEKHEIETLAVAAFNFHLGQLKTHWGEL